MSYINRNRSLSIEDQMYGVHALSIDQIQPEKIEKLRTNALDLADASGKTLQLHKKAAVINDLVVRSKDVLAPYFISASFDHRKVIGPTLGKLSCQHMEKLIKPFIDDFRDHMDYNGLHFLMAFLEFRKQKVHENNSLNDIQIFKEFQPNSSNEANTHGTTCVGSAQSIVDLLAKKEIYSFIVVGRTQTNMSPNHAAVAVPCSDGVLVIEAGDYSGYITAVKFSEVSESFYRATPPSAHVEISIKFVDMPDNLTTTTPIIMRTFSFLDSSTYVERKKGEKLVVPQRPINVVSYQYILRPINNPDQSIMKKWFLTSDFYPISSKLVEGKEKSIIKVNCIRKMITFQIGEGPNAKKAWLPFGVAINEKTGALDLHRLQGKDGNILSAEEIDQFSGNDFFKKFSTEKELLMHQLVTVVANAHVFKNILKK